MRQPRIDFDKLVMNRDLDDRYVLDEEPYDKLFTGVVQGDHPNGVRHCEIEYVDGMQIGFRRIWFPTGQMEVDSPGTLTENGIYRKWHSNGKLAIYGRRQFHDSLESKHWDEEGNVIEHRIADGVIPQIPDNPEEFGLHIPTIFPHPSSV